MTESTRLVARGPDLDPKIIAASGETLVELLDLAAARTPDSIALLIRRGMVDERWTYRDLATRSADVAQRLRARGVTAGQRILTWSRNDPWLVAAYFGAWRAGAIIVPLDLRMQTDVAVRIGRRAQASLLLVGEGADEAAVAALSLPTIAVDQGGLLPDERAMAPNQAAVVPAPIPDGAHVRPEDVAEILFTSGTTSDPKGVVLTHAQIVHSARAIAQTGMGPTPDRGLAIIPMSHMYGQAVPLLMGLISGSTLVFLHSLSPKAITATMRRERITAITLVPQYVAVVLAGIESEARRSGRETRLRWGRRLAPYLPFGLRRLLFRSVHAALGGHLRVISSGGARLDEELQAAWEAMGVAVVQGYGTTECAVICGHTRSSRRPGTAGPPLAGLEIRIATDSELLVRGPNVMQGYWAAPDATAEVLDADGWLYTGDAATIDDAGEIIILGRTRDRISLPNGLNVYPDDVESALTASDAIRAAVVFEVSAGRIAAALLPGGSGVADSSLEEAVKQANRSLAPHQRVSAWKRWPDDDFPRTHTLKVRRGAVEAWYRETADGAAGSMEAASTRTASTEPEATGGDPPPAPPAAVSSETDLESLIATLSSALDDLRGADAPTLGAETRLEELGLDSLDTVTVALRIDEAFDAPISDDEIAATPDMAALLELVRARQGQPAAERPSLWAFSPAAQRVRGLIDATVGRWLVGLVARPRVEGLEHLRDVAGPVLICPNHQSHLDAPTVRASLPAPMRARCAIAAAADTFFDGNPIGPVVALVQGALPFGRRSDVRASLESVADLINDGWNVMLFPEGTRARDGHIGPMRSGIGLLATNLRVPVIPVHIEGAWEILPPGARVPSHRRRSHVRVRFGAPLTFGPDATVQSATDRIGQAIEALGRD